MAHGFFSSEEDDQGRPVRWTAPEAVFALNAETSLMRMFVSCPRPDLDRRPAHVQVFNAERKIGGFDIMGYQDKPYVLKIPEELRGRPALYRLAAAPAWRPSETMDCSDDRLLGILFQRIDTRAEDRQP